MNSYFLDLSWISAGLVNQVREILTSRTDLYKKVLLYEPIFVEDLHAILKANKVRCSIQALLDALDELVSFVTILLFVLVTVLEVKAINVTCCYL